ncbi:MAG: aminotransferase class V-fold PLP-dependent enzyme [Planctomycetota bacterium]
MTFQSDSNLLDPDSRSASDSCPTEFSDVWSWWRNQMPVTERWAYFDHAAVAPLSEPASDMMRSFIDTASQHGDVYWLDWSERINQLRSQFAELTHCEPDEVALVPNTTAGINLIAEGFPFERGDSVVVPEGEFPSNRFPWLNQKHRGVEVKTVPRRDHGEVHVDDLINAIDSSTRLIAVSWVGYATGFRIDLDDLVGRAHQRGVLVLLDAIQGLGMYPLNVQTCDVDFVAADGHKWMLGPEGAGIAIVRRRHLPTLHCCTVGWGSVKQSHAFSGAAFDLADDASRFEGGSANMPGLMAFSASVDMFLAVRRQHGPSAIQERVLERASTLRRMLLEAGAELTYALPDSAVHHSSIVNFRVPRMTPADFRARGIDQGVVVSCRGDGIRASVHVYNNDEDLKRLVDLV